MIPPEERRAPIVSVIDGTSSNLAFLGAAFGLSVTPWEWIASGSRVTETTCTATSASMPAGS
jgi:hypothetical protein